VILPAGERQISAIPSGKTINTNDMLYHVLEDIIFMGNVYTAPGPVEMDDESAQNFKGKVKSFAEKNRDPNAVIAPPPEDMETVLAEAIPEPEEKPKKAPKKEPKKPTKKKKVKAKKE